MTLALAIPRPRTLVERVRPMAPALVTGLLFAAIGVELMTLAAWMPDTVRKWWDPDRYGYSDFDMFYLDSKAGAPTGQYNVGIAFVMKSLTWLDMRTAYQVYVAVNFAAMLGVAYLAQRGVRSLPAKTAVVLGVIALPQTQWVLRIGHFTPVLALLALGGLLLVDRRPMMAGVLFGAMALKPQYLPVLLLYLVWTRRWRALAGVGLVFAALTTVGIAVVGFDGLLTQLRGLPRAQLDQSGLLTGTQQAWQYSWQGFLISAGVDPNPLLTADLMALSLASVILVWWKGTPAAAKTAAALGMLLLVPYSTFYNWCLIAVPGALLLRAELRPSWLKPVIVVGGAIAAAATQKATPFPASDMFAPAVTYGLYWIQPAALLTVFILALASRREAAAASSAGGVANAAGPAWERLRAIFRERAGSHAWCRRAGWAALAVGSVAAGYLLSAFVSHSGPFRPDPFARDAVLRALPYDFPAPPHASIEDAGKGELLPYRVEWTAPAPAGEVAGVIKRRLNDGNWEIVMDESRPDGARLRVLRYSVTGNLDLIGEVTVQPAGRGSSLKLEFTPLPTNRVKGYDEWRRSRGR
ncbi:MAG TPA: glycosyltransferase family 87 protein [Dehalococcoidia bacterium]|nr:glycosyltransferase family 87 protein [Dehalococcoidia bacterium]